MKNNDDFEDEYDPEDDSYNDDNDDDYEEEDLYEEFLREQDELDAKHTELDEHGFCRRDYSHLEETLAQLFQEYRESLGNYYHNRCPETEQACKEAKRRLDHMVKVKKETLEEIKRIEHNMRESVLITNIISEGENYMSPLARTNYVMWQLIIAGGGLLLMVYAYFHHMLGRFALDAFIAVPMGALLGYVFINNVWSILSQVLFGIFAGNKANNPAFQNWRQDHHLYWDEQFGEKFDPNDISSLTPEQMQYYDMLNKENDLKPMRNPRDFLN